MRFSLILATKNRVEQVERFLRSLTRQQHQNFELIIVDQNNDNRLQSLIQAYGQQFKIVHLKQEGGHLARARNLGCLHAQGDLITFPDDDSVYPPEILAQVVDFLQSQPQWDGVVGRVYDLDKEQNAMMYCGDDHAGEIDQERALRIGMVHATFVRNSVSQEICFDESLGLGSGTPWTCGEDVDYLFRCLKRNFNIYYHPKLIVRHPNPFDIYSFRQLLKREYSYGRGNGYLIANNFDDAFVRGEITQNFPYVFTTLFKGQFDYCAYIVASIAGMTLGYWDSVSRRQSPTRTPEKSTMGSKV